MAVFHGGLELPVLDGVDGLFIEPHTQAAQDADVAGTAVGSYDEAEGADALVFRFASLFRKLRLRRINLAWRGNAAAYVKYASAGAAALAWTKARALAGPDTAATARTNAATRAC